MNLPNQNRCSVRFLPKPGLRQPAHRSAFTLIEFIGVLTIIAILALVLTKVVIKRVDIAAVNAETASLNNINNALVQQVLRNYQIPSETNWAAAVGNWLSLPVSNIATNARHYNRVFVYDSSGFSPMVLPYTQSNGLSALPSNPRMMIISSLSANLPLGSGAPSTASFNDIWNTPAGKIPGTWTTWGGRGDDLLIQRVNLLPLFHRLILNAIDTNKFGSYVVQSGAINYTNTVSLANSPADAWYFQGTTIGLYDTNSNPNLLNLESKTVVQGDASYVFENWAWRGQLSGWGTNGPAAIVFSPSAVSGYLGLINSFTNLPNPNAGSGATPYDVARCFYDIMNDYNFWVLENFAIGQDTAQGFLNSQEEPVVEREMTDMIK